MRRRMGYVVLKPLLVLTFVAAFVASFNASFAGTAVAAPPPGTFFQGFEQNTNGWTPGADRNIVRVPSGYVSGTGYASGIPSAAGRYHARLDTPGCVTSCDGPFTRWGGYSATFPPGGYLTQLDIYLDTGWAAANDTLRDYRFDWISAISNNTGAFLRDFVFNVGTTPTGYIIQTSTNSTRSGANPNSPCPAPNTPPNTCRPPVLIGASGWYTFRHTFRDNAGQLAVDFDIIRQDTQTLVAHQTIIADPMSVVGGNRYGWFSNEEINDLAIDNALRTGLCKAGDGDGERDDNDGHHHHSSFHGGQCTNAGGVSDDDEDSGQHFESTSVTSSAFTFDEGSQTLTMIGTGLDGGVPVGFTMVAVDYSGVAPAVFELTLTSGRVLTGTFTSGAVAIQ